MKRKALLLFSLIAMLVPFTIFPVMQVSAASNLNQPVVKKAEFEPFNFNQINKDLDNNFLTPTPRAGGVVIFFGGMAIGWVVDGIISYATGRAPSEWVRWGLKSMETKVRNASRNRILVVVSYDGTVNGCSSRPCPIRSRAEF